MIRKSNNWIEKTNSRNTFDYQQYGCQCGRCGHLQKFRSGDLLLGALHPSEGL